MRERFCRILLLVDLLLENVKVVAKTDVPTDERDLLAMNRIAPVHDGR
jgi:hypothetical protein